MLYTPDIGFSGTDSFTYKATDSQGVDSRNLATVIMTINGSYHSSSSGSSNSSNSSSNMVDPFGIREIYPTKAGGEQWFMNMSDITHDPRASFEASNTGLTRNPDGSWKVLSTEVRFNVLTSSGYHHELITRFALASTSDKNIGTIVNELLCRSKTYTAVSACDDCSLSFKSFCN